jgi:hypothetical protein
MARRWLGVGVGAAGVVGVVVGAAFGLKARSKLDQSNDGPCDASDHCSDAGLALRQDAESAARVATIAMIAGAVAVGAGVVLYVTAPSGPRREGISIAPMPLPSGGGAVLRGQF